MALPIPERASTPIRKAAIDPTADNEAGYNGTTVGDGYSVHDEYRGFHYIQDLVNTGDPINPTGVVKWTSTDPGKMQDLYAFDPVCNCRIDVDTRPNSWQTDTLSQEQL
jgi:hypothetical protein